MRWHRVRQSWPKYGITSRRLAVRPHLPWYVRWGIALPFVLMAVGFAWWAYNTGLSLAGYSRDEAEQTLAALRSELDSLREDNQRLSSQAAVFERQAQIEHSANQEMARQLHAITEENTSLQEDLAFFRNLAETARKDGELSMHRLKIERDALPGEYRLRLLLAQNAIGRVKEFNGRMQLLLHTRQDGEMRIVSFPPQDRVAEAAAFQLNFKYYQRIDHSFKVSPDVHVERVQVRIFERNADEPILKQEIEL